MTIGVAIVTYNSSKYIAACISSVRQEGIRDIAIVDSASEDATALKLTQLGCVFQKEDSNKGFGYAANRAAAMLNTEYVLFLNPDAALQKGSIENLMRAIHDNPKAGIIGMLLHDANGTPEAMAYGKEPTLFQMVIRHFQYQRPARTPFRVDWVSGGALLIQKKVFEQIKGFDEAFFLYWEDVDLCKRVREKGYAIYVDPNAKVTHIRGGSRIDNAKKTTIYDESADRYFKKHYSTSIWNIQHFLRRLYRL